MLLFGKQRLVSPLAWANTLRTWDGISAILKVNDWTVTGFYTHFAPVRKYKYNEPDARTVFWGVHAAGKVQNAASANLNIYFYNLERDRTITFNGTAGTEQRRTVGGRVWGKVPNSRFDYDFEGAYQFGEVGSGNIEAFMVAMQAGYTCADRPAKPRMWVGFDYASGDKSAGGDVQTFNQLFPLGHAFLGYIDAIGRQNIIDASAGISVKPRPKLTINLAGHAYWLADNDDALYNAGGGVVRAGGASTSRSVGGEVDLTAKYKFDRHHSAVLGYSHFFAGDVLRKSGPSDDVDFLYLIWLFVF